MKPENFEETVVFYTLVGTYVIFFLGLQTLLIPGIAWGLFLYFCIKLWRQTDDTPPEDRVKVPIGVWIWVLAIAAIGIALIAGHLDFNFTLKRLVKSLINFYLRTWCLLALFPLIGCLKIRPKLMYRAVCILCLQHLVFALLAYLMSAAGVQMPLYFNSLAAKIGGVNQSFYAVSFYVMEEGKTRLTLIGSWAPAIALAGNVYFFICTQDSNAKWRWIGIIGSALIVWGSGSRLGLLCLVTLPFIKIVLINFYRPTLQIAFGVGSLLAGLLGPQLIAAARDFKDYFDSQRASSSRVREVLGRLALYKWEDAQTWGHGILKPKGPPIVAGMPIGSHHTWYGLLYSHGIVGFIAFAIPMLYSAIVLFIKAQKSKAAQSALMILLVMFAFSFGENLEVLAYLYWPGLVMLGIALKERFSLFPEGETA